MRNQAAPDRTQGRTFTESPDFSFLTILKEKEVTVKNQTKKAPFFSRFLSLPFATVLLALAHSYRIVTQELDVQGRHKAARKYSGAAKDLVKVAVLFAKDKTETAKMSPRGFAFVVNAVVKDGGKCEERLWKDVILSFSEKRGKDKKNASRKAYGQAVKDLRKIFRSLTEEFTEEDVTLPEFVRVSKS